MEKHWQRSKTTEVGSAIAFFGVGFALWGVWGLLFVCGGLLISLLVLGFGSFFGWLGVSVCFSNCIKLFLKHPVRAGNLSQKTQSDKATLPFPSSSKAVFLPFDGTAGTVPYQCRRTKPNKKVKKQ